MKLKDWDDKGQDTKGQKSKVTDGTSRFGRSSRTDEESGRNEADDRFEWESATVGEAWEETGEASEWEGEESVSKPGKGRNRRPDEEELEGEGWEEDDLEELPPLKPWAKVLIFLGLVATAAIICAILWHFVHPDKSGEGDTGTLAEATQSPDVEGEPTAQPDSNLPLESDMKSDSEAEQDLALNATAEPVQEPDTGNAGENGTETDQESGASAGQVSNQSEQSPTGQPPTEPEEEIEEPVAGNTDMKFGAVQESVTPKDVVNLRSVPTTADSENIVTQAQNGETLTRIGVNDSTGWSQIDYDGQILYAVSQYLTTDLSYKPPVKPSDPNRVSTISGRIIIFKNCDDWISPKEYVNLRTEPSTTEGQTTVSCQLNYGEKAHRTGSSTDSGWSRVEYNGEVLYVVTSLVYEVPAE